MTIAVILCLVGTQWSTLFAAEPAAPIAASSTFSSLGLTSDAPLGYLAPGAREIPTLMAAAPSAFAGQIYRGRPIRANNDGSVAAMIFGAAATITGTALLIYANRPDCSAAPYAGGCGYGMKVIGGSVLAGGIAGLMVGALTWK
jgi:hypothetical protein